MKKYLILVLVIVLSMSGCVEPPQIAESMEATLLSEEFDYDKIVSENPWFVHALGGSKEGQTYLNSLDIMEKAYERGFRLFEGDARLTSDGRVVMVHGWSEKLITKTLGQAYNKDDPVPTYDEFMSWIFPGGYRATSWVDVLNFMRQHEDVVLMLDSGLGERDEVIAFYEAVVREAGEDRAVLDRVMLSALNEQVLEAALEVYPFILRNIYLAKEEDRSETLKTVDQVIAYGKKMGCQSSSVSTAVITEEICKAYQDAGLYLYAFTTNEQDEADRLREYGATSVGTDFLG